MDNIDSIRLNFSSDSLFLLSVNFISDSLPCNDGFGKSESLPLVPPFLPNSFLLCMSRTLAWVSQTDVTSQLPVVRVAFTAKSAFIGIGGHLSVQDRELISKLLISGFYRDLLCSKEYLHFPLFQFII